MTVIFHAFIRSPGTFARCYWPDDSIKMSDHQSVHVVGEFGVKSARKCARNSVQAVEIVRPVQIMEIHKPRSLWELQ